MQGLHWDIGTSIAISCNLLPIREAIWKWAKSKCDLLIVNFSTFNKFQNNNFMKYLPFPVAVEKEDVGGSGSG